MQARDIEKSVRAISGKFDSFRYVWLRIETPISLEVDIEIGSRMGVQHLPSISGDRVALRRWGSGTYDGMIHADL
jgi:hypothetical protein